MTLPVVEPPEDTPAPEACVAGVLLAAGRSERFGDANKLLVEAEGAPLVRHAADTLLESRVDSVTVVVGHEAGRIREALHGLDVDFVENPNYREGQATYVEDLGPEDANEGAYERDMRAWRPFVAPMRLCSRWGTCPTSFRRRWTP